MGTVRNCDARCHGADGQRCVCWCGGVFHGAAGEAARQAFRKTFVSEIPSTEQEASQASLYAPAATPTAIAWAKAYSAPRTARGAA